MVSGFIRLCFPSMSQILTFQLIDSLVVSTGLMSCQEGTAWLVSSTGLLTSFVVITSPTSRSGTFQSGDIMSVPFSITCFQLNMLQLFYHVILRCIKSSSTYSFHSKSSLTVPMIIYKTHKSQHGSTNQSILFLTFKQYSKRTITSLYSNSP